MSPTLPTASWQQDEGAKEETPLTWAVFCFDDRCATSMSEWFRTAGLITGFSTVVGRGELGFDYLRDQMAPSPSDLSLREGSPRLGVKEKV